MEASELLSLIAASHSLFLALLLWRFAPSQPGSSRLALFLVNLSLCFCADSWMRLPLVYQFPQLAQLFTPLYLLIGPLLLFYVQRSLGRASGRLLPWLHCSPALLFALLIVLIAAAVPTAELRGYLEEDLAATGYDPLARLIQLHVGLYLAASIHCWYRFERAVRAEYASPSALRMRWLLHALLIFSGMWLSWLAGTLFGDSLFGLPYDGLMVVGAYLLGYSALLHRQIALPVLALQDTPPATLPAEPRPNTRTEFPRYVRSRLSNARTDQLRQALDEVVGRDCPFLDPDLTLSQLADSIGATTHELSQLLNENLGSSFFDYINRLRVEDVKRCLDDPAYAGQTILEIALASGFSSKAAFNAAFKRMAGMTPSSYRSLSLKAPPPAPATPH